MSSSVRHFFGVPGDDLCRVARGSSRCSRRHHQQQQQGCRARLGASRPTTPRKPAAPAAYIGLGTFCFRARYMNSDILRVSSTLRRLARSIEACSATRGLNPNLLELLPGTRLIVRRRAYFHHGIYAGNGRVIHYAGWFHSVRGLVEEVTIEHFTAGRRYSIGRTPANRQRGEQVVQRARSRLGERCYHLLRNNCEHFCNWCQLGESRSEQIETLARPTILLFGLLQSLRSELLARLLGFRGDLPKAA